MINVGNPYGLDLDRNGVPLNTARNMAILEEVERTASMATPHYGGGYPQAGYPQVEYPQEQAYGYPTGVPAAGGVFLDKRDNYYPETYHSSRDSNRFMYKGGGASARTNPAPAYLDNYYSPQTGNTNVHGGAAFDRNDYEPYPKATQNHTPIVEPEPTYSHPKPDNNEYIAIPHNGIYHWTLLPKHLWEKRTVTNKEVLKEGQGKKIIGNFYVSNILRKEESGMNWESEDKFSEELFKEGDELNIRVRKTLNIENARPNATEDELIVGAYNVNHLVNRLLTEHSRIANFSKDNAYVFDYINMTAYFSSKSKNLFLEKAKEVKCFKDAVMALEFIYEEYSKSEVNINSLRSIDAELTKDFLAFIRGFTGDAGIKIGSYMQSVGRMHIAADNFVDVAAQKNIKAGIERFTNMLFINIRKMQDTVGEGRDRMLVPRKELSVICANDGIKEELAVIKDKNEAKFFFINEEFTPELFSLLKEVDNVKILSNYSKITLFTITGLYQVVKTKDKGYYISLMELFK